MTALPANAEQSVKDEVRYGIFLIPDARLVEAAIQAMLIAKHHYALTAALVYPPHITLVGSIAIDGEPMRYEQVRTSQISEREDHLVYHLDKVMRSHPIQRLRLREFSASQGGYLAWRFDDRDGNDIAALVGDVVEAIAPMRIFHDTDRFVERHRRISATTFRPHLTVVGHDGAQRLSDVKRLEQMLIELGYADRTEVDCDTVSLYRFASRSWSTDYWDEFEFFPIKTWKLA